MESEQMYGDKGEVGRKNILKRKQILRKTVIFAIVSFNKMMKVAIVAAADWKISAPSYDLRTIRRWVEDDTGKCKENQAGDSGGTVAVWCVHQRSPTIFKRRF
jgi:hypothetical protein